MRFVLATVALVIAIGLAGFGVAQRTILNGANNVTAEVQTTSDAAVTVIGGTTLNSLDGRQNVAVSGSDTIFAAYARTSDVLAWIGDTTYNEIGFDAQTLELTSTTRVGAETAVPSPAGSDLWLRDTRERTVSRRRSCSTKICRSSWSPTERQQPRPTSRSAGPSITARPGQDR